MNEQIDLSKSTGVRCRECNGLFFEQAVLLRKFSKLLLATPTDQIVPVAVFLCKDCGTPCKDFFPEGMTDVEQALNLTKNETNLIL